MTESDDGEICGHGNEPSFPVTEAGQSRKPCGQDGRAQCQTRSKYDRFAGLTGSLSPRVPESCPQADGGWWPELGKAVRILGMGDVSKVLPDG
ncbi:hypothetical protein GCM10023083_05700 [Streptomyces phyllanthi]